MLFYPRVVAAENLVVLACLVCSVPISGWTSTGYAGHPETPQIPS